jgi:cytochrome c oxidase subunit IV
MEIGRTVMLIVSILKAFLVVTFFMHLWWEAKWKYVVTIPAMLVSILLVLALVPDIGRRTREYEHARWLNAPEPMPYPVGNALRVAQPAPGAAVHGHHAEPSHHAEPGHHAEGGEANP